MNKLFLKIIPYTPLVLIVTAYACIFYETWYEIKPKLSKKDCIVAEFSPDFNQKEKELCRKLRGS